MLFAERLLAAPAADNFRDARQALELTLNWVEDEYSGVAFNPGNWADDGRIYPPYDDYEQQYSVAGVRLFYTVGHSFFIADFGAIRIKKRGSAAVLRDEPGLNGELCPREDAI